MNRESLLTVILFLLGSTVFASNPENFVFKAGESGYSCFRVPTMVVTQCGKFLAFSEGRVNSGADEGDMDIVIKRSTNYGKSWLDLQVIENSKKREYHHS